MKIEVLCHSSIRIEGENKIIYIDPYRIKEEKNEKADLQSANKHLRINVKIIETTTTK